MSNRPIFLTSTARRVQHGPEHGHPGRDLVVWPQTGTVVRARVGVMTMQDLIFVAITIAFFALSLGYVHFCDRVK